MFDGELIGRELVSIVRNYLEHERQELRAQIKALEERIAGIPAGEKGDRGDKGDPGLNGKDGAPGEQGPQGERGESGLQGKDGRDGIDGKDGAPGPAGERGIDGINGKDGRDGKDADVGEIIRRVLEQIPTPRDGLNGKDGAPGVPGDNGRDGRDGLPGPSGRDALDIDILEAIEDGRSYPVGTFAKYRGGLVRANRNTEPIEVGLERAGWSVIVEGMDAPEVEFADDLRTCRIKLSLTSGRSVEKTLRMPTLIYREVFKRGATYVPGDCVTWDGSVWVALEETGDVPGTTKAWRLSVKRGADAKPDRK